MVKSIDSKTEKTDLRKRAEKRMMKNLTKTHHLSALNLEVLTNELQVHQIELEMQNEELKKSQLYLMESQARFIDLYDYAPVGYFTLDGETKVQEANLTGTEMLGMERDGLIGQAFTRFIVPEDQDIFYLHCRAVLKTQSNEITELRLMKEDGSIFNARLDTRTEGDSSEAGHQFRTIVTDITEHKRVELDRERLIAELKKALEEINTLKGFIPICAYCKKIRDDKGYWEQLEKFISEHSEALFSHCICPDCMKKYFSLSP